MVRLGSIPAWPPAFSPEHRGSVPDSESGFRGHIGTCEISEPSDENVTPIDENDGRSRPTTGNRPDPTRLDQPRRSRPGCQLTKRATLKEKRRVRRQYGFRAPFPAGKAGSGCRPERDFSPEYWPVPAKCWNWPSTRRIRNYEVRLFGSADRIRINKRLVNVPHDGRVFRRNRLSVSRCRGGWRSHASRSFLPLGVWANSST